jgi:hypothetical protein
MIIFGKASINDDKFTYETFTSMQIFEQYWKFLHCNPTYLGHVDFSVPCGFDIKKTLGKYSLKKLFSAAPLGLKCGTHKFRSVRY